MTDRVLRFKSVGVHTPPDVAMFEQRQKRLGFCDQHKTPTLSDVPNIEFLPRDKVGVLNIFL